MVVPIFICTIVKHPRVGTGHPEPLKGGKDMLARGTSQSRHYAARCGYDLKNHHHALADAEACESQASPKQVPSKSQISPIFLRTRMGGRNLKLLFNWQLGRDLVQKKAEERWGARVVEQVSLDLNREFPNSTNFSLLENRLFRFGGE